MILTMDELERRFDGAIPEYLKRAARLVEAKQPRQSNGPTPKVKVTTKAVFAVPFMAAIMVERLASVGLCTAADLANAGCNASTIAAHADAARRLASEMAAKRGLEVAP